MKQLQQKGFSVIEVLLVLVVLGLIGFIGWIVYDRTQQEEPTASQQTITSFAECKAAGYPIAESSPEQCHANGQTYTNNQQVEEQPVGSENIKHIEGYDKATTGLKFALLNTFFTEAKTTCLNATPNATEDTKYLKVHKVVRDDFALIQYCGSGAGKVVGKVNNEWRLVGGIGMGYPGCADVDKYKISKEISKECMLADGNTREVTYP